jgi:hypothetical protein
MYKPEIKTLSKTVSVKPMKLFPVHSFNGS